MHFSRILGFATSWQGGRVGGQYNRIFSRRINMKIEFSSQSREMLLFLTTTMAAVTSHANQQYGHLWDRPYVPCWDHVGGQYSSIFSRIIYMKIEFSSQRREMLLFLTTNMAAVMSHANQLALCGVLFFICFIKTSNQKTAVLPLMIISNPEIWNRPGFLVDFLPKNEYRYATNICFRIYKVLTT